MKASSKIPAGLRFHPLTPSRWADFERLFGARGACGGCWCMWWRTRRSEWERLKGDGNRRAMKAVVRSGTMPGILAYSGREAVGWCALAPREEYAVLENSRILKRVDDRPVWSVVCFFIAKGWRNRGLTVRLLEAAADHARRMGARILEGYPTEPKKKPMPAAFAYTGLAAAFRRAGFTECARRSETRPIMRRALRGKRTSIKKGRAKKTAPAKRPAAKKSGKDARVLCRTPTPGKKGVRIDAWKYDAVRKAVLAALGRGRRGAAFKELPALVQKRIPAARRREFGSVTWYTVTVKLDLEVRGEIERVPGMSPQRLRRVLKK